MTDLLRISKCHFKQEIQIQVVSLTNVQRQLCKNKPFYLITNANLEYTRCLRCFVAAKTAVITLIQGRLHGIIT